MWTKKLKNTITEARGSDWREALNALAQHTMSNDAEELLELNDKWDEWFENNFGRFRTDGRPPIDIDNFKSDLSWILTDKLPENLNELISKYEQNGMRQYKKLYIWTIEISDEIKQSAMSRVMNPKAAANGGVLAEAMKHGIGLNWS